MKVYVMTKYDDDGCGESIETVFTSKEKADRYIATCSYDVFSEEVETDVESYDANTPLYYGYCCTLKKNGDFTIMVEPTFSHGESRVYAPASHTIYPDINYIMNYYSTQGDLTKDFLYSELKRILMK